jgi:hypothetical protein
MKPAFTWFGIVCLSAWTTTASASVGSKVVQEAIEYTVKKFAKEAATEGIETLGAKMAKLAAKHGDELVSAAFRKVGPRASKVVIEAGEHGGLALKLLGQHGDKALSLTLRKTSLEAVGRYGDNAITAIMKHGSLGDNLIGAFGREGAEALARVSPQNGRRLAMLAGEGALKQELVDVVAKHGDRACEFIWKNKGALAVGAGLATFVASPDAYLDGTQKLVSIVAETAVKPLAAVPAAVAGEAAKNINWNLMVVLASVFLAVLAGAWMGHLGHWVSAFQVWLSQRRNAKGVRREG